jgi:FdhE protein
MAQRILEPGQIETLAQRSIPRVRVPDRELVFIRRASRLRQLAHGAAMGDYLRFLAALVDAQHMVRGRISAMPPDQAQIERCGEHRMPPIDPSTWSHEPEWLETLTFLCAELASQAGFPPGVGEILSKVREASPAWIDAQADAVLGRSTDIEVDAATAPLIMAALQVRWVALAGHFAADQVNPLDVPGLCPLCGSLPVASVVYAESGYQGYRYLHCSLCATEWHMVRVQCSQCGTPGKDIAYHSLEKASRGNGSSGQADAAVRAETCEHCRGYRKILYQEKDPGVEPVADDVASFALDVLLGELGYHRASGNPLLWQSTAA